MAEKRIYIADDDQNIREAIKAFLENDGYLVHDFEEGNLLLDYFQKEPADLLILDVMMPGLSGFEICKKIRETSTVPIIMLSALDTDLDYVKGISLGSDDYFTKPFSLMALVMRVKAIFRRIEYEKQQIDGTADKQTIRSGNIEIDKAARKVMAGTREISLTPNEYDLLVFLMERKEQAISREELLTQIWGYNTEIETRATDDTVRRLRKKIEDTTIKIETVWGYGFRLHV